MHFTVDDFDYELPEALIAQHPPAQRRDARLMVPGALHADTSIAEIGQFLRPGDLLVLNNTQVIPARLWGRKASGGRVEALVERLVGDSEALCHLRSSKSPKAGSVLHFGAHQATVTGRDGALFRLEFGSAVLPILHDIGHMPLPPYISRDDSIDDQQRYQTVFAEVAGAVAAPTAGLHFDERLLASLAAQGVESTTITLHVGAGTFQPVREDIDTHVMHAEWIDVSDNTVEAIARTRACGGRVVAVGTTVVRALESAAQTGTLRPYQGDTRIFITPGFSFQVIDVLLTNFHLPRSTLLMLVSAFAGMDVIRDAYAHAIGEQYRFFSYGDAMLLHRSKEH